MTTDKEIQDICTQAIELPQCPMKKAHAVASRAWLFSKITDLLKKPKNPEPFNPIKEYK